jgi:hypothetical protein
VVNAIRMLRRWPLLLGLLVGCSAETAPSALDDAGAPAEADTGEVPDAGDLTADSGEPLDSGTDSIDGGDSVDSGDPFSTPVVCTSNVRWTRGDRGSRYMHPGGACETCHTTHPDAPTFGAAGTVYPTAHEPNDCDGIAGVTVIITDANGSVITLTTNSAGNFYFESPIAMPLRAKVISNGQTREMLEPQMTGDCNSCHTVDGNNAAPGRILMP